MNYFFSKKSLPNYIIWLITLTSSYTMKFVDIGDNNSLIYYLLTECVLWFFIGVVLTVFIQIGLEKCTQNKKIAIKIIYLLLFMIIASILFNFIFWPIIDVLHEHILGRSSYHGKFATRIFNWFNWIVWFISITALNLYKHVQETNMKNLKLVANLKEVQLNTLKEQLNPHFMFNSLNNIRGLMLEDVNKARKILTSLSEVLRYSLNQNNTDVILLEEELEMVEKYIDISKIQFEKRLTFELNVDQESLGIQIPPMIIQVLVENAIKHGISNLKKGGKITVTTTIENKELSIIVVNSGILSVSKKSTKIGLKNITKRLELLYNNKATFSLKELNKEVVATIKIPV